MRDENEDLLSWVEPPYPDVKVLDGHYVRLELLSPSCHAPDLFLSYEGDESLWDYMPDGPFFSEEDFVCWLERMSLREDIYTFALYDKEKGVYGGLASFLRIFPAVGCIEVGYIALSSGFRGTRVSTEALYLMMKWAFESGYRRYEWKCHAGNMRSRRAAERLGFLYEGTFRQATIMKGRNRDTAWYSCIDKEWFKLKLAFEEWLCSDNFDEEGKQKVRLSVLTSKIR
jgi:RimJ/RimL family protein N-acetyltransferase